MLEKLTLGVEPNNFRGRIAALKKSPFAIIFDNRLRMRKGTLTIGGLVTLDNGEKVIAEIDNQSPQPGSKVIVYHIHPNA
jgi:hypothetical protein